LNASGLRQFVGDYGQTFKRRWPSPMSMLLAAQLERVERVSKQIRRIIPVPLPSSDCPSGGNPRGDFRKAWTTACQKAGVPGMLRHDLRRTAVRNMVNLGVPGRVAMKVTAHKTLSVFDRYHTVSPGDLQDVARRLAGTLSGTPPIRKLLPAR
jgi:integrase